MNIALIGMRGSGKTVVGKLLAERLGKQFVEMDELIVRKARMSIPEIVERYGWDKFRDIEEEVTREVAVLDNVVNATGGGVVTRENNVKELRKTGKLAWLEVSLDTLLRRIGDDPSRPSLTGKSRRDDMEIVLTERSPIYQQAADFSVDTEGKKPEAIAEEIIDRMQKEGLLDD